jgi:hypothetical protein
MKVRVAASAALVLACVAGGGTARADGPGVGSPWVVTLGDSYISGEAGRWAGNTNNGEQYHDALGASAYADDVDQPDCHRSRAAEAFIATAGAKNFACSGATTGSYTDGDGYFKPGLDFSDAGAGKRGQAKLLQNWASSHNVKFVVVSIGGNDFNFGSIVQSCVTDFLYSPSWWPDYCYDDSSVSSNFTPANVSTQTAKIKQAFLNVKQAMTNAGYASGTYTIVAQDYPSPVPRSTGFRYSESGYTRQSTGGCGFWNRDANWANDTALPTINSAVKNGASQAGVSQVMELQSTFNGRRLCENTVGLLEEKGLASWRSAGAVDQTEWINQIRTVSTCCGSNYWIQESLHPNYWGQLALRNCVRQAYAANRGGTCAIAGAGLTSRGEPNTVLR